MRSIYNRDLLAEPLRQLESLLQRIRTGAFLPDASRSALLAHVHMCLLRSLSVSSNMSTSLESTDALKSRASEVALTTEEANALANNGVSSLARLAFAACAPGQTPTDDQLTALLRPVPLNPGNAASLKRLIFEAQTLICSEVKSKAGKREDSSQVSFAAPERDARIVQQRNMTIQGRRRMQPRILRFSACSFGKRLPDVPWS